MRTNAERPSRDTKIAYRMSLLKEHERLVNAIKTKRVRGRKEQCGTTSTKHPLQHCITSIDCEEQRKFEIENEHIRLQQEISKINKVSKEANKMLRFNPCTKNHQWTRLTNQATTQQAHSRYSNSAHK